MFITNGFVHFFQEYVSNITEFMIFCNLTRSDQFSIDAIRNRKIISGSGKLSGKNIFTLEFIID
jgi:hypothetical protein